MTANTSSFVILIARNVKLERLTSIQLFDATTVGKYYNRLVVFCPTEVI